MELVRLIEHLTYLIYFEECCARRVAQSEATTKVCYLIVRTDIALLSEHTQSSCEHVCSRRVFLLMNGDDAEAEVQPALSLILVADGKNRVRTAEYGAVG